MSEELKEYMSELGTEGRLIKIQYEEIMLNKNESFEALIRDYQKGCVKIEKIVNKVKNLTKEDLLDDEKILNLLGYDINVINLDEKIEPRGYGLLNNISKITKKDKETLIKEFSGVQSILAASVQEVTELKGISKFKALHISKALRRIKNKTALDRE